MARESNEESVAKWNFKQGTLVALISVFGTVTAAYFTSIHSLSTKVDQLQKRYDSADYIAKGLAVGYAYNFIRRLEQDRQEMSVDFQKTEARIPTDPSSGTHSRTFDDAHIRLEIIFPDHLTKECLDRARNKAEGFPQAMVEVTAKERPPRINYAFETQDDGTNLIIVIKDFPQTLYAVTAYAQDLGVKSNSGDWLAMEKDALSEFHDEVESLHRSMPGLGVTDITWVSCD